MDEDTKAYRSLSRQELLELLIEECEKTEELERQLREINKELSSRDLKIKEAGSIAEAALSLNGVFEAAQAASVQYIESIKEMSARQDEINAKREEESKKRADMILNKANRLAKKMEDETRIRCQKMLLLTKEKILQVRQMAGIDES